MERADHPCFWQSVTGSLEERETDLLAAARREVREETGLAPARGWRDWHQCCAFEIFPEWRHRYAPGVTHNREHVFSLVVAPTVMITLNPREHHHYCWLGHTEAARRCTSWSNRDAIERIAHAYGWR